MSLRTHSFEIITPSDVIDVRAKILCQNLSTHRTPTPTPTKDINMMKSFHFSVGSVICNNEIISEFISSTRNLLLVNVNNTDPVMELTHWDQSYRI